MSVDMSDPATRAAMAERLSPAEYNRAMKAWRESNIVSTVNGYAIRRVPSRFGMLFQIADGVAYTTQVAAEGQAAKMPKGPV